MIAAPRHEYELANRIALYTRKRVPNDLWLSLVLFDASQSNVDEVACAFASFFFSFQNPNEIPEKARFSFFFPYHRCSREAHPFRTFLSSETFQSERNILLQLFSSDAARAKF